MKTSKVGLDLVRQFEGFKYKTYLDGGGVLTVGYGHTIYAPMLKVIEPLTQEQIDKLLVFDLSNTEDAVNSNVTVKLKQCEFDALVCLVFNIGPSAFKKSTLLKLLNTGDKMGAANQFTRWTFDNGKEILGLVRRRNAERALFLGGK